MKLVLAVGAVVALGFVSPSDRPDQQPPMPQPWSPPVAVLPEEAPPLTANVMVDLPIDLPPSTSACGCGARPWPADERAEEHLWDIDPCVAPADDEDEGIPPSSASWR